MRSIARAATPHSPGSTPSVAGRYVLQEKLGEGGMGVVYRAEDQSTQRTVALKQLLLGEFGSQRRMIEVLFEREYHTLARLKHPSIIDVYDYGIEDTGPYYTMELLSGNDLRDLAPMPYIDLCRHLRDVASALALLHAHRLVHRDLSPRNVRLSDDGRAKLLDFGALTSFGRPESIVGTPPFVAPELLHRLPVDQRADLFALGALAYWGLTGKHAFPAKRLADLSALWSSPPPRPSSLREEVPQPLDDLVMSLLSIDPLGRPAAAAEVIDRLSAIAGLPAVGLEQSAEGYLLSGKLVGRQHELHWMNEQLSALPKGRGALGLIEGNAGIGKTRLLDEFSIKAQLAGVRVLRADIRVNGAAFGGAAMLAEAALIVCRDLAVETGLPYAAQLGHLSPAVRRALGEQTLAANCQDPAEEQARMQAALRTWFSAMTQQQRLMVIVDNVDLADAGTGTFLAALGKEAPERGLILIGTESSASQGSADGALRALRSQSVRLKLSNFTPAACEEFCVSLFGDVTNVGRLARVLHDKSGGNPQLCMELAYLLVKRQIAKYVGGTWVLPQQLGEDELPSQMEQIISARLGALHHNARGLAEALCVFERQIALDDLVSLLPAQDERAVFASLDELITEDIVVSDGGATYRFAHESLRRAIYVLLDAKPRTAHHLRAAQTILAGEDLAAVLQIEAGGHLLKAGEETRGAELMVQALRRFKDEGDYEGSPELILRAVHTALQIYERQKRGDEELLEPLVTLVSLSFLTDWRLNLQYGERAIQVALRVSGLELARKLHDFLPRPVALGLALMVTFGRLKLKQLRGKIHYDVPRAIEMLCTIIPPAVATSNICYDVATVARMVERLEPLSYFGERHIASLMRDFAIAQLRMGQGRELEALEDLLLMEQRYCNPKIVKLLGKDLWSALYGGVLFSQGVLYPYWFGETALKIAERMEQLGFNIWRMAADQIRLLYHALRGESEQMQRFSERVELFAVQGGTTWQAEMFWPVLLLSGTVLNGDTIGVRRLSEQLRRRGKDAPGLRSYARAARACYAALRGEHAKAIRLFTRVLREIQPRERVAWHTLRAIFAGILNDVGQHARAKELLLDVLSRVREGDEIVVGRHLELSRQLALAEVGLGRVEHGARMLDQLLEKYASQDQPLLVGLLHKARAEVALVSNDSIAFETHLGKMGQYFHATRNPALVAQWENLADRGARKRLRAAAGQAGDRERNRGALGKGLVSPGASAREAHAQIVSMLATWAKAEEAHLYSWNGKRVRLLSSIGADKPPSSIETALNRAAAEAHVEPTIDRTATVDDHRTESVLSTSVFLSSEQVGAESLAADVKGESYRACLLSHWTGSHFVVVGGLCVKLQAGNLGHLDVSSLAAAAAALYTCEQEGATAIESSR